MPGQPGTPGAPGTAAGYAEVNSAGAVDAVHSKSIAQANVEKNTMFAGRYCIKNLTTPFRSAQVSAEDIFDGGQSDVVATVFVGQSGNVTTAGCTGGLDMIVDTYDISSGGLADRPFYLWIED